MAAPHENSGQGFSRGGLFGHPGGKTEHAAGRIRPAWLNRVHARTKLGVAGAPHGRLVGVLFESANAGDRPCVMILNAGLPLGTQAMALSMIRQDLRLKSELKLFVWAFGSVRVATTLAQPSETDRELKTPAR